MTIPGQVNSLLMRLQHARKWEFAEILQELLGYPEALDRVVPVVSARIDAGDYVLNEPLALLIAQTRSSDLCEKVRDRLFLDDWALLTLYKGRYPDPEIEKELCKRLYSFAATDGEPRRLYVLEAMHNVGSTALLPTLEALLFDLGPSVKVREAFGESLGIVGALEAKSRIEFVRLVSLAIEDMKDRARTAPETTEPPGFQDDKVSEQVDQISHAARAKEQVKLFIDTKQPEAAIIYIRRGAEALAKDLYRRSGFEKNAKPARKMMLDELLQSIKGSNAPDMLKHLLQTFQLFGNFATHDQDDQSGHITMEIAVPMSALFDQALSIYSEWKKATE